MFQISGGCQCGNIRIDLELMRAPGTYNPRACDCDFCRNHNAAYVSDPQGALSLHIKDERLRRTYRQGSGQAEFWFCTECGVLVGVLYRNNEHVYAAVNSRAIHGGKPFGAEQSASPKALSPSEKASRWQQVWFPEVRLLLG